MSDPSIDEQINAALAPASKAFSELVFFKLTFGDVEIPLVVLFLMAGAVFFTIYFRGINLRGIPLAVRVLKGDFDEEDADPASSATSWSTAMGASCNDGDACTTGDVCTAEGCAGTIAGDSYEPNATRMNASRLGDVSDGDSFPAGGYPTSRRGPWVSEAGAGRL